jgi:hypothetical protein
VHQASRAERQVQEDAKYERNKGFFASRNVSASTPTTPKPSFATSSKTFSKPPQTTTQAHAPPSIASSKGSTTPLKVICFKCGVQGHKSFECKNTRVMITKDNGTVDYHSEGEYEAFVQAVVAIEADDMGDEEEHVLCTHDTSPSLVITKVLTTHSQDLEDQRCNIFQTKAGIHGKSIKVIIDGGSCHNLASTELCTKINLQLCKHAHPYHVQWLSDNSNVKIQHTVSVTFKIGAYEDTVECDVVPMMVFHVLLGHPWQFDKKAIHNGHANVYTFKEADKTFMLRPMTRSQIIADNAKALARAHQVSTPSEMSDERPNHNKESERHKLYMSDKITHALIATKSEMRDLHHNPSTLHFVLICKGIVLTTNEHSMIPSPLLSDTS